MNKNNTLKIIFYCVICLILLFIQSKEILKIYFINPDFILISVIIYAIFKGEENGLLFSFIAGLIQDSIAGILFGMSSIVFIFICLGIHIYKKYIFISNIISFWLILIFSVFLKYLLFLIMYLIFHGTLIADLNYLISLFGETLYNLVVGTIMYLILSNLLTKKEEF